MKAWRFLWRLIRQRAARRWAYRLPVDGAVFIVVTLLIGLAAMNTSAQLLYLVFGMLCAFWILSDFMATISMNGLRVRRVLPRVATAREPVRVEIEVENKKPVFGSFSLRLLDDLSDGTRVGAAFVPHLSARARQTVTYDCAFPRRGRYEFRRLTIATRFPFGLIERQIRRETEGEILILPAIVEVGRALRAARADFGETETHQKGQGTGLYAIREYRPGESARMIHWKVSARADTLMVREYESNERRRTSVILDNRLVSDAGAKEREALEKAIVLASSVASYLVELGHEVELVTASGRVPFGTGSGHATRCRRSLALLNAETAGGEDPWARLTDEHSQRIAILMKGQRAGLREARVLRVDDHDDLLAPAVQLALPEAGESAATFEALAFDVLPGKAAAS